MSINASKYQTILQTTQSFKASLVAVSKKKPVDDIQQLYALGQRAFGENYVQELLEKQSQLPTDIAWHFLGHLQKNKVKQILPFIHLIQSVDSVELLEVINKEAKKINKKINCLLQIHISNEATKFGFDAATIPSLLEAINSLPYVSIQGLMGMASNTTDTTLIQSELQQLNQLLLTLKPHFGLHFSICSMGMSSDYLTALQAGSTLIRIGSLIFGNR